MTALSQMPSRSSMPLREAFERIFEDAFTPFFGEGGVGPSVTPVNVWETQDSYQVAFLVPGVDPQSVEISALGNTITVAGEMVVNQPDGGRYVWQEFGPARFRRQIGLPLEFDSGRIEATYRDGILLLNVPKAEHSKARSIKVQVQGS